MARGFGTGGYGGRGSSSRGGNGAKGNSRGNASRTGSRSAGSRSTGTAGKPKGQVRDGKAVQYSIRDSKGNTKYIGTTNNPARRAGEHRESGKLKGKDKLVVESRAIDRSKAERVEAAKLSSHRQSQGGNPRHNVTSDGKYHQPPLF